MRERERDIERERDRDRETELETETDRGCVLKCKKDQTQPHHNFSRLSIILNIQFDQKIKSLSLFCFLFC